MLLEDLAKAALEANCVDQISKVKKKILYTLSVPGAGLPGEGAGLPGGEGRGGGGGGGEGEGEGEGEGVKVTTYSVEFQNSGDGGELQTLVLVARETMSQTSYCSSEILGTCFFLSSSSLPGI